MPDQGNDASQPSVTGRDTRAGRIFVAQMAREHALSQEILVRNISRQGLAARARGSAPTVGERVVVTLGPWGDIAAIVQWVRGDRFGLKLTQEIATELFNFAGKDWTPATNKTFEVGHVFDHFKPSENYRRPPVKPKP